MSKDFTPFFCNAPAMLTEGAVGTRIQHEYGIDIGDSIKVAALIYDPDGRRALEAIYRQYLSIAEEYALPILLMANTRRVNRETVARSPHRHKSIIRDYVGFLRELAGDYRCEAYIGGIIGCKGDAYTGEGALRLREAEAFHEWQADALANAGVDFAFEGIMPALGEAIAVSELLARRGVPYITSFMIRRDGRLIDGHSIHDAITAIDAAVPTKPLAYMVNCVHPDILRDALDADFNRTDAVRTRFAGIQANAACGEACELDSSREVLSSSADGLLRSFKRLHEAHPMRVFGGCCGTDDRHMRELARWLRTLRE
jgi:S-methylmethionine-dependent homocysteine/selenocysteine methylase